MNVPSRKKCCGNFIQWLAVLSAFVLNFQVGLFAGWFSPNFARLLSDESPIHATKSDLSWIASLSALSSVVGSVFGSMCMEYVGSRKTMLLTYFFISISLICLLFANSIEWIYASRIIGAIPVTIISGSVCIYLGEILSPKNRGAFISLAQMGATLGSVLGAVAETYLLMKISSSIYLAAVLVGILLLLCLHDTPYYLMKKNNFEGARKSIEYYHAGNEIDQKFEEIKSVIVINKHDIKNIMQELRSSVSRRLILAIAVLFSLHLLSGYGVILAYMEIILTNAKFDLVKPKEIYIYMMSLKVLTLFVVIKLIDRIGRRLLIIISSIGTSISMFGLGLHFYLLSIGFDEKSLQWLPITSIVTYLITFICGFGTVPHTLLSEMFPEKIKSTAVFIVSTIVPLMGFVTLKAYQPFVDFAGEAYVFWTFSVLCLSAIPCALFLLIETKGKSCQEIQNELIKKWHR